MSGISKLRAGMNPYFVSDLDQAQDLWGTSRGRAQKSENPAQESAASSPAYTLSQSVSAQTNSNVMSGNFSSAARGPSRYVSSTIESFHEQTLQDLSQSSGLFSLLDEVSAFARSYSKAEVDGIVTRSRNKKLYEEVRKNAEEMRKELERKAAEAAAPKDANGEPIIVDARIENSSSAAPSSAAPGESIKAASPNLGELATAAYVSSQAAIASLDARHAVIDITV